MKRVTIHYAGRVQGVGFRATAARVAAGFEVAGHVQNLPSGEVRLVAQGSAEQVEAFVQRVGEAMRRNITSMDVREGDVVDGLTGFSVRY
jgi:acylphosphatase